MSLWVTWFLRILKLFVSIPHSTIPHFIQILFIFTLILAVVLWICAFIDFLVLIFLWQTCIGANLHAFPLSVYESVPKGPTQGGSHWHQAQWSPRQGGDVELEQRVQGNPQHGALADFSYSTSTCSFSMWMTLGWSKRSCSQDADSSRRRARWF